jgi:membrane-bound lytic murein transglycosylase A
VIARAAGHLAAGFALFLLAACGPKTPPPDRLVLQRASFADLPGWSADDPAAALPALAASCKAVGAGSAASSIDLRPEDWREACAELPSVSGTEAARAFFERRFAPYFARNGNEAKGLFTGYYEAELHGSHHQTERYSVPLYRRPPELVTVDLGRFRPSLEGERIAGKVERGALVPYPARAEIERGALAGRNLELVWVDSAVDAFFLAIQGSGRVTLDDGKTLRVGYDGDNGRPYVAIGRVLVERGVPKERITMPFLRDWLGKNPDQAQDLLDANPSFVFFQTLDGPGPLGSQGVALTAGRSVAVDRRFVPMGLPVWIDTTDPVETGGKLRRLFVAQDTGGAIRGPVRADIFFGFGSEAANHAGVLKGTGSWWLLLPRPAADRIGAGMGTS